MRHNDILNHRTSARNNNRVVTIALELFIVSAIIVAGIAALIIRSYRSDTFLTPETAIITPEFRVVTTPHDDICYNVFDTFSNEQNIKGFFQYNKFDSGCIARQMSNGARPSGQD
jgi:hypothetical protein